MEIKQFHHFRKGTKVKINNERLLQTLRRRYGENLDSETIITRRITGQWCGVKVYIKLTCNGIVRGNCRTDPKDLYLINGPMDKIKKKLLGGIENEIQHNVEGETEQTNPNIDA